jgi:hypothetical protein
MESTVIRTAAEPRVEQVPAAAPARRGRGVLIAVVAAVVVVVVAGIVLVNMLTPKDLSNEPVAEAPGVTDDGPIVGGAVPVPALVSATLDGTTAAFAWSNPDGDLADTFVWQRTDGAGDPQRVPTSEPSATIEGVDAGTTVCIDIWVRRGGELSPDPLSACTP